MEKLATLTENGIEYIYIPDQEQPKYCNKCGKELMRRHLSYGYDVYTGKPVVKEYMICPTLQGDHFIWDMSEEYYG